MKRVLATIAIILLFSMALSFGINALVVHWKSVSAKEQTVVALKANIQVSDTLAAYIEVFRQLDSIHADPIMYKHFKNRIAQTRSYIIQNNYDSALVSLCDEMIAFCDKLQKQKSKKHYKLTSG